MLPSKCPTVAPDGFGKSETNGAHVSPVIIDTVTDRVFRTTTLTARSIPPAEAAGLAVTVKSNGGGGSDLRKPASGAVASQPDRNASVHAKGTTPSRRCAILQTREMRVAF